MKRISCHFKCDKGSLISDFTLILILFDPLTPLSNSSAQMFKPLTPSSLNAVTSSMNDLQSVNSNGTEVLPILKPRLKKSD